MVTPEGLFRQKFITQTGFHPVPQTKASMQQIHTTRTPTYINTRADGGVTITQATSFIRLAREEAHELAHKLLDGEH